MVGSDLTYSYNLATLKIILEIIELLNFIS